jgi:hypothetical protein
MRNILLLSLLFLTSCSSDLFKNRDTDQYFTSTGVEKYFLSELPAWANFSEAGACKRQRRVRFFDINQMMKSFNISYAESLQIQATYNADYMSLEDSIENKKVSLKEEELLFFKASEKVSGKIHFFDTPTYKKIYFVWIDTWPSTSVGNEMLNRFLKSKVFDEGFPVLLSQCLAKNQMEHMFHEQNFRAISSEMWTLFNSKGEMNYRWQFELENFFNDQQKITLYTYKLENLPKILKGKFNWINL